jgi:hypothetical protein
MDQCAARKPNGLARHGHRMNLVIHPKSFPGHA